VRREFARWGGKGKFEDIPLRIRGDEGGGKTHCYGNSKKILKLAKRKKKRRQTLGEKVDIVEQGEEALPYCQNLERKRWQCLARDSGHQCPPNPQRNTKDLAN